MSSAVSVEVGLERWLCVRHGVHLTIGFWVPRTTTITLDINKKYYHTIFNFLVKENRIQRAGERVVGRCETEEDHTGKVNTNIKKRVNANHKF